MEIRFETLTLQCRKSREVIDLSHALSFFHGKISSGKSSLVRLVNFLMGADLEKTAAIQQELISASLICKIKENQVLLERETHATKVKVTWENPDGKSATVLVPVKGQDSGPVWNDNIFNLSDLFFYLLEVEPLKVKRSKIIEDSPLIRLSFRDFITFCYLDQDHLDSSFYRFNDPILQNKSRDVMRFVVGFFSEKLSSLEKLREEKKDEKLAKRNSAKELESFLDKFGYGGEDQINSNIEFAQNKLKEALEEQKELQNGYQTNTHSSDDLRQRIRALIKTLERTETALNDLDYKINEQESLRAELMSSKFKLARSKSVVDIFANVAFEKCPSCGTDIHNRKLKEDYCGLCYSKIETEKESASIPQEEAFRLDLDARINELELSIKEHKRSFSKQKNLLIKLNTAKYDLDLKLRSQVERYESTLLSTYRDIDQRIATYKERLNNYEKVKLIPEEIARLEKEADQLVADDLELRRKIETEKSKLTKAGDYIEEIQNEFLNIMLAVGLPGVSEDDEIIINKKTWDVSVLPDGEDVFAWNFNNAGSGGKKTLFKVCYGLALHLVAARNKLPLPKFLIIDTPMKNIGEEVNKDIFEKFYKLLYDLYSNDLSDHQFIIVDKEFIAPDDESNLDIFERYMTPDEKEHPPLISYYNGP